MQVRNFSAHDQRMKEDRPLSGVCSQAITSAWVPALAWGLVAAGLRLMWIGRKPLWLDEVYSLTWGQLSLSDLWDAMSLSNVHPPLYFAVLHFFLPLATSEQCLRLLSALSGIATIPLVYGVGNIIGGTRVGTLSAMLVAISPWHVAYGQEARMYALLTFWTTLATYGLARLLTVSEIIKQHASGVASSQRRFQALHRDNAAWLAYIGGTTAALWTHNVALFLPIATNLVVLIWWSFHRRVGNSFLRKWCFAQIAVLLLWSPWIFGFIRQVSVVYADFWIAPPDIWMVIEVLRNHYAAFLGPTLANSSNALFTTNGLEMLRACFDILVWGLAGLGMWAWRQQRRWISFALLLWLVAPFGALVVSLWRPIFLDRLVIWTSIPFYLLIAAAINELRPRAMVFVVTAIAVVNVFGIRNYHLGYQKEAWDKSATYVAEHVKPEDLILFHAFFTQLPFDYYFRRKDSNVTQHGLPYPFDYYFRTVVENSSPPDSVPLKIQPKDLARLQALVSHHRQVWLVSSHYSRFTDPQNLVPCLLARLGQLDSYKTFHRVSVSRYRLVEHNRLPVANLPLTILPTQTGFSIDTINDQIVQQKKRTIIDGQGQSCIVVRGWAVDINAKTLAGAVYVDIDGKLYSANYGIDRKDVADHFKNAGFRYSGYEAFIGNLPQGHHTLSLRVLPKDIRGYYKPENFVSFEVRSATR